jgi:hypothetical protein
LLGCKRFTLSKGQIANRAPFQYDPPKEEHFGGYSNHL